MNFGDKLRGLLEKHDMTQKELADKAGLGHTLIKGLVNNRINNTSVLTLEKIAAVFNIKVRDLFDDENPPIPQEIRSMDKKEIIEWFELISVLKESNNSPKLIKKLAELKDEIISLDKK